MMVLEPFDFDAADAEFDAAAIEGIERDFRVREARRGRRLRKAPMFFGVTTDAQTCKWCEGEIEAQSRHIVSRHGAMHEECFERWSLIDNGGQE